MNTLNVLILKFHIFIDYYRKTIQQDLIQDIMLLCIETHKVTGMDIEDFLKIASENILPLCRRITNCALAMWVVWLSTAQVLNQTNYL